MAEFTIEQAIQLAFGYYQSGRLADAEGIYRQILAQYPDHADTLHLLAILAEQVGHTEAAIDLIHRAISINPTVAEYHGNLGEFYRRSRQLQNAIEGFRRAIALKPEYAEAHSNLGIALKDLGLLDEAIMSYQRAILLKPDLAEAHCNLGVALHEIGRAGEAIASYNRAIQLKPEMVAAYNNLGNVLGDKGRLDEAIDTYRRAIALDSDSAASYDNLGNLFKEQGRLDEALACFRKALHLNASFPNKGSNFLYSLHFHPDFNAAAILAEHRLWARLYAEPLASQIRIHENDRAPDRRLTIGFLSPDLRDHPVGQSLIPLFSHYDRRHFEIVCFSDVKVADKITEVLKALTDRWRDIAGLSDQSVADWIAADRIDILVDLALHTANNRLLVFARRPAPVQVTMLGMPATTGLGAMDYRLTDRFLDPPGVSDGDYTEQSIRLPCCYWCYCPVEDAPPVGVLPALKNGFVTFGCLNQFAKVSRPAFQAWMAILRAVPGARLVIHSQPGSHREAVRALFEGGGIASDRVEFVVKVDRLQYLYCYHKLDLCLDPFPYNGGITTMDSLWMGVPVVTLAGRTAVGRAGVSILSNLGLTELIAQTPEQYVAIAVQSAGDLAALSGLRTGLRQRMEASPLLDGRRYATDVEVAFRRMWKTWCDARE